jgi:TorA maturation chaperone TorD
VASTESTGLAERTQLLVEVLESRSASYRMLSRLFLKPLALEDIDTFESLDLVARAREMEDGGLIAEGFNDMGRGLRRRHTGTRSLLATDYTMCFDGLRTVDDKVAVPYASVHLSAKGLLYQEPRNDVYRAFRSAGVCLEDGIDLPEDHLSFELEFLAVLSDRAREVLDRDDAPVAAELLATSRDFLENNVLSWTPLFVELSSSLLETRFYQGAVKFLDGYLALDRQTLDDLTDELAA